MKSITVTQFLREVLLLLHLSQCHPDTKACASLCSETLHRPISSKTVYCEHNLRLIRSRMRTTKKFPPPLEDGEEIVPLKRSLTSLPRKAILSILSFIPHSIVLNFACANRDISIIIKGESSTRPPPSLTCEKISSTNTQTHSPCTLIVDRVRTTPNHSSFTQQKAHSKKECTPEHSNSPSPLGPYHPKTQTQTHTEDFPLFYDYTLKFNCGRRSSFVKNKKGGALLFQKKQKKGTNMLSPMNMLSPNEGGPTEVSIHDRYHIIEITTNNRPLKSKKVRATLVALANRSSLNKLHFVR